MFTNNLTTCREVLLITSVGFFALTAFAVSLGNSLHFIQSVSAIEKINDQNLASIILQPYQNIEHGLKLNYPLLWEEIENRSGPDNVVTFFLKGTKSNEIGVAIALYDIILPYANLSANYTNLQINSLSKKFNISMSNVNTLANCPSHEVVYENQTRGFKAMQVWTVKQFMGKDHVYLILYITDTNKFTHYLPLAKSSIESFETTYDVQRDPKCP